MNLLAKNLVGKFWCHQREAFQSLKIYYQKVAYKINKKFFIKEAYLKKF